MPGVCPRCHRDVYFAEERLALGKVWHVFCFSCRNCRKLLDSCSVATYCGELFCQSCYIRLFSTIIQSSVPTSNQCNASTEKETFSHSFRFVPASTSLRNLQENRHCIRCCNKVDDFIDEVSCDRKKNYRFKKKRLRGGGGGNEEVDKTDYLPKAENIFHSEDGCLHLATVDSISINRCNHQRPFQNSERDRKIQKSECSSTQKLQHQLQQQVYVDNREKLSSLIHANGVEDQKINCTQLRSRRNTSGCYRDSIMQNDYNNVKQDRELAIFKESQSYEIEETISKDCSTATNDKNLITQSSADIFSTCPYEDAQSTLAEDVDRQIEVEYIDGCKKLPVAIPLETSHKSMSTSANDSDNDENNSWRRNITLTRTQQNAGSSTNDLKTSAEEDRMRGGHGGNVGNCGSYSGRKSCHGSGQSFNRQAKSSCCRNDLESKRCGYQPDRRCDGEHDACRGGIPSIACSPPCLERRSCPPSGCRPICGKIESRCSSPCMGEPQGCGGGGCCGSGCRGGCGKPGQICMPVRPFPVPPCRSPFIRTSCSQCCDRTIAPEVYGRDEEKGGGSSCCRSHSPRRCRLTTGRVGSSCCDDTARNCCTDVGCCRTKVPTGCECLGGGVDCQRCGQKVYQAEMQIASGVPYHNICFSCFCCRKPLEPLTYQENCGEIYCKQCYIRNFGPQGYGYGIGAGALQTPL